MTDLGMKKDYEAQYHLLEEDHYWFRGRRHVVHELVLKANRDPECRILEIGCSGGPLIQQLHGDGYRHVTGIDISAEGIEQCRRRGLADTHVMDAQEMSFADGSFDVVTASDVLEHLADAPRAIREWRRLLKPGGTLIVFVPAFQFLWTEHDEANKHFRRYHRQELSQLLAREWSCRHSRFLLEFCALLPGGGDPAAEASYAEARGFRGGRHVPAAEAREPRVDPVVAVRKLAPVARPELPGRGECDGYCPQTGLNTAKVVVSQCLPLACLPADITRLPES